MTRRVVITGMGTLNPLGHTVAETWANMVAGVSGIAPITAFDTSNFLVKIAGEVKGFDPMRYMEAREARRRDRCQQLACAASREALATSGLRITPENAAVYTAFAIWFGAVMFTHPVDATPKARGSP